MDEIRVAFWSSMKRMWPINADTDQSAAGHLRVTFRTNDDAMRPNKLARWVSIRFSSKVIDAMQVAGPEQQRVIAGAAAKSVERQLSTYDPSLTDADAFIVTIEEDVLDA